MTWQASVFNVDRAEGVPEGRMLARRDYEAVKMWGDANRHGKVSRALLN